MPNYYGTNGSEPSIIGSSKDDYLFGFGGNDKLLGGNGNDYLNGYGGGREIDTLQGGAGADTFALGDNSWGVFYRSQSYGIISSWTPNVDVIQVKGSSSQYSLQLGYYSGVQLYADTLIYYGNDLIGLVQDSTNVNLFKDFIYI